MQCEIVQSLNQKVDSEADKIMHRKIVQGIIKQRADVETDKLIAAWNVDDEADKLVQSKTAKRAVQRVASETAKILQCEVSLKGYNNDNLHLIKLIKYCSVK